MAALSFQYRFIVAGSQLYPSGDRIVLAEPAFKFPHQAILDHAGATRNFEVLQPLVGRHTADIDSLDRDVAELERSLSVVRLPGVWTNPEAFTTKLTETSTLQVRREQAATSARLKGTAKSNAKIPAGTALFTLPAGFRPPANVHASAFNASSGVIFQVLVLTTGVVEAPFLELPETSFYAFDSITFHLT